MGADITHRLRRAASKITTRARTPRPIGSAEGFADEVAASYFGVTRFSVFRPGGGAWKLTRSTADPDAYREQLWSADRMRPRCDIFLTLTVPILQQMADRHDYRHIVMYSEEMPDPWRSELLAAAEQYPVLCLQESVRGETANPSIEELLATSVGPSRTVVRFRLDDDDILGVDYLDRLSAYTTFADRGRSVSLASGYSALYDQGTVSHVRAARRLFASQGLAAIGFYDAQRSVLTLRSGGAHHQIDRSMPTIVDSREPVFFQMRHTGQDTVTDTEEARAQIVQSLDTMSPVPDMDAVLWRFPTLAGHLG